VRRSPARGGSPEHPSTPTTILSFFLPTFFPAARHRVADGADPWTQRPEEVVAPLWFLSPAHACSLEPRAAPSRETTVVLLVARAEPARWRGSPVVTMVNPHGGDASGKMRAQVGLHSCLFSFFSRVRVSCSTSSRSEKLNRVVLRFFTPI
jgi:hypothetical protein